MEAPLVTPEPFQPSTLATFVEDFNVTVRDPYWNISEKGSDGGSPDDGEFEHEYNIWIAIFLSIFCMATVFGNLLVMIAVARERYLHSVTNYFITSLAVADCLVGLVVMPFQAIFELMGKKWIFGDVWCDLWHSFDVLASTSSILNLCVISLDRYWAITDPFTYPSRMTTNRALICIATVWIMSSCISFPAILWWRVTRDAPIPEYKCPFTQNIPYLVFSSIISFYGPLFVMVFVYYRIYKAAVEQTRSLKQGTKLCTDGDMELTLRIHRGGRPLNSNVVTGNHDHGSNDAKGSGTVHHQHNANRHPAPAQHQNSEDCEQEIGHIDLLHPNPPGNGHGTSNNATRANSVRAGPKNLKHFSISRKLAKFAKEKKAAKTLGIVMGVFIVCWLPFFVTNLISGFCSSCFQEVEFVTDITTWLGWINSGMNPVIYACMSKDFRR